MDSRLLAGCRSRSRQVPWLAWSIDVSSGFLKECRHSPQGFGNNEVGTWCVTDSHVAARVAATRSWWRSSRRF
jgi:hypothetical protein